MGHADTRMVETVYARTRHEGVMKNLDLLERLNALWKGICDTFCDKLDLQKTYTTQGKIGGQMSGFVIDFVIIRKSAENRSQKYMIKT